MCVFNIVFYIVTESVKGPIPFVSFIISICGIFFLFPSVAKIYLPSNHEKQRSFFFFCHNQWSSWTNLPLPFEWQYAGEQLLKGLKKKSGKGIQWTTTAYNKFIILKLHFTGLVIGCCIKQPWHILKVEADILCAFF